MAGTFGMTKMIGGSNGRESKARWKQAINDGCPIYCSYKVSIYYKNNLSKD